MSCLYELRYLYSSKHILFVTNATVKPKFTKTLEDYSCLLGSDATFMTSLEGVPKPQVKVKKDGHEIQLNENMTLMYEGSEVLLSIKNATLENVGKYEMEAKNDIGSDTVSCNLDIHGKSLILNSFKNTSKSIIRIQVRTY